MLEACGLTSAEDLFAHLPAHVRLGRGLQIGPGLSEYEIVDYFKARAAENASDYACFLGAGAYRHYRPVLVDTVVSRGEFLTAYTPYQAEISQGTLTAIFEFQTMLCQLTGMDVANASMYDGSSAVPEAAQMAARITGRKAVVVSRTVHPEYRAVLRTYARHQEMRTSGRCPGGWWARPGTAVAGAPSASPWPPASSTFGARRPPRTSAPTRP